MRKEIQEVSARKPYEKPQIRRVKLETIEATLGAGCWNSTGLAEAPDCTPLLDPCDQT